MATFLLCGTITGLIDCWLPVVSGRWSDRVNENEQLSVTINVRDPAVAALNLKYRTQPAKVSLIAVENGVVVAGGPIWTRDYDSSNGLVTLQAKGLGSLMDFRLVLPVLANTIDMPWWTVPNPDTTNRPQEYIPNPDLSTVINGFSRGTVMKCLVQQTETWPGGALCIDYQANDTGDPVNRTYLCIDFKPVSEALFDLNREDDACEYHFTPYFSDATHIRWKMQTGTSISPIISSGTVHYWEMFDDEVLDSPAFDLAGHEDGSNMGGIAFVTGGRRADRSVEVRAKNNALVAAGYPLMMLVDSTHSTEDTTATLQKQANSDVMAGKLPEVHWNVKLIGFPTDGAAFPYPVADYHLGDLVDMNWDPFSNAMGVGDPWMPGAKTRRMRIVAILGDEMGDYVSMELAPQFLTGSAVL